MTFLKVENINIFYIFISLNLQNKKASIKEAFKFVVEMAGFEPATPCSQSRMN